jgi:NAD(P)-dependent dehydrogenase (short-subunit alcohol dehydrogenase family)
LIVEETTTRSIVFNRREVDHDASALFKCAVALMIVEVSCYVARGCGVDFDMRVLWTPAKGVSILDSQHRNGGLRGSVGKAAVFVQFSSIGGRIGPPGRGPYSAAKWGVEGFSEVLSREVAPLGIKVTIIEPGGFRTDFAGSCTKLSEGHPEYDSTVGATARFQRDYNGKQPGAPKKAAQAIVQLMQERKPPLRLLPGSDAYNGAEKNDLARLEGARTWKELSLSTDLGVGVTSKF